MAHPVTYPITGILQGVTDSTTPAGNRMAFDIETLAGTPEELDAEFRREFPLSVEEACKDAIDTADAAQKSLDEILASDGKVFKKDTEPLEKLITKAQKEIEAEQAKREKWVDKAALKNSARVLCACFTDSENVQAFTWMTINPEGVQTLSTVNIAVNCYSDEQTMLAAIGVWLAAQEPIDVFAAHNGYNFDMPKMRQRFGRFGIRKPDVLHPSTGAKILDTQKDFGKYYSMEQNYFASLGFVAGTFGLDTSKIGKGSEVDALYKAGEYVTILAYCAHDALLVYKIMERMEDF